jgi:hypothetical protein
MLEEHHVDVCEPGGYYLTHFTACDGEGQSIANKLFESLANTKLMENILVCTFGSAAMTEPYSGYTLS